MSSQHNPAVVIDNGTGYTKMGYSSNVEPQFVIPTAIATQHKAGSVDRSEMKDLDFYVGDEAVKNKDHYSLNYPITHGLIENWSNMERLWQRCIFKYMRCDPEEHYFLLTEPPMNPPENREYTAEVMFETFNVPGLYIAVQACLALAASYTSLKHTTDKVLDPSMMHTGTVIDSGDGVTHIVPVSHGYVIGSCIRHIPLAGRDVTKFILNMLKDRKEAIPPEDAKLVAKLIKERHCYTCKDVAREFQKFDQNPDKCFRKYSGINRYTHKPWSCDIGYERFLGPEIFFNPEIFNADYKKPLSTVVDEVVQACEIDTRRGLYNNIVLSGGSTLFRDFHRRLQRDIKGIVNKRIEKNVESIRKAGVKCKKPTVAVNVVSHPMQRYAVWFGGSILSGSSSFYQICHTKEQYDEEGPRICRHNAAFTHL
eukprot:g3567.t1